ncbi:MAG: DNA polymerase III subunit gamma/tau, partial [Planctomycetaceae bacterium]
MTEPAAYQVVARRYRPQRFDELVGQEHVARGLSGAIQSGRIGHAYLFCGARGTGKTSAARIFAKALECAGGPVPEPCNACDACLAIAAGNDVDVVEIDAASNRGVDEIRQLRQNVAVRPAHGRFKIYIIDEVHMLTREAFNALLKTLEEPPAHVKFVLCTTEPEKLPITILSRCQRFDFTTVAAAAIATRLAQIVEAEGADVTAEALHLIARRAAGSMRDSQSLLEQLLGAATGPIGADDVHAMIGTGREERVGTLLAALADRDAPAALAALDAAVQGGADPGGVLDQLVAALRDCLVASVGCGKGMLADESALGVDCAALGGRLGTATILAMLQIIDQSLARMAVSGHAGVLAEMAVVRLATLEDLDSLAAAVDRVGIATPPPARPAATAPREKKTADPGSVPPPPVRAAPTATRVAPAAPAVVPAAVSVPPAAPADPLQVWRHAAEQCGGLAADFALTATAAEWRGDAVEVTIPTAQALSFLGRPEVTGGLATALAAVAGRPLAIRLAGGGPAVGPEPAASADRRPAARPAPGLTQAALMREAADHPLVAHARQVFVAAIRRVEPPRPRPARAAAPVASPGDGADDARAEPGDVVPQAVGEDA